MFKPLPATRPGMPLASIAGRHLTVLMAALLAATAIALSATHGPHARATVVTLYAVTGAGGDTPSGGGSSGGSLSNLYTLDASDGSVLTGPVPITINAGATQLKHVLSIAVHPTTGVLYGVVNGQQADYSDWGESKLITINPATGAATVIGELNGAATCINFNTDCHQVTDLAFDPFGNLYAWNYTNGDEWGLTTIDLATGLATFVGTRETYYGMGLAIDSAGAIYAAGTWDENVSRLSHSTGNVVDQVTLGNGTEQQITDILAFDAYDTLYAGKRTSTGLTLFTLDPTDGTLTSVGTNAVTKISAIAFAVYPVTPPDNADLSLDKDVDDPTPEVGTNIHFTLTVTNGGPDDATGVKVNDDLSGIYNFVDATGDGTYDDATGVWNIGTILNGDTASLDIEVTVGTSESPNIYNNEAVITDSDVFDPDSFPGDPDDQGDIFDEVQPAPFDPDRDASVSLTVNGPTRAGGKTKGFRVTVSNVGSVPFAVNQTLLDVTVNGTSVACKAFGTTLQPGRDVSTRCTYSPATIGFGVGDTVDYEATVTVQLDANGTNDVATFSTNAV